MTENKPYMLRAGYYHNYTGICKNKEENLTTNEVVDKLNEQDIKIKLLENKLCIKEDLIQQLKNELNTDCYKTSEKYSGGIKYMKYIEALKTYKKSGRILEDLLGEMVLFWEDKYDVKMYYSYGYNFIYVKIDDIPLDKDDVVAFEQTFGLELCCMKRTNYVYSKKDDYACNRTYIFEGAE